MNRVAELLRQWGMKEMSIVAIEDDLKVCWICHGASIGTIEFVHKTGASWIAYCCEEHKP